MNDELSGAASGDAKGRPVVLVTEGWSDGIAWVDPAVRGDGAVIARTEVGKAPWGIAVHAPSERAYVATAQGLAVVDLASRSSLALVPYLDQPDVFEFGEERPGGTGVVVTPDGGSVYVAVTRVGRVSTVEQFDVAEGKFVGSVEVGARPFDVQISRDGSEIYTIDHDSFTVHTITLADQSVVRAEVAPFGTEGGLMSHQKPHYAAVSLDGLLYMPYQGRGLVAFDPRTQKYTTAEMTGDTHQHGVALTSDGRLLVVGVGAIGGATQGPSLTVRELATGEETLVPLDKGHEGVLEWVEAPGGRSKAVLMGGSTSRGPWDGLTVIDLDTFERYEVPVAGRPQAGVVLHV
ncbi:YncE family protein [Arthrobacter sp. 35W]|uniref:YncE family protein n=1 Tax=Arthrobacter sp. 35W TaxID=1132441 RepID=UPI0004149858|nr:YncE family protein [Arthrobacter sp. 35W]